MKRLITALFILLTSTTSYAAAEAIGKVILSFGQNVAIAADGSERALKRKDAVYSEDLIKTGSKGRIQIRFTDGSRLSLKPDSEFQIAEYKFEQDAPEDGKAIYKLLKGGMRTISGQIGKVDRDDYRVETVVATIGIRGTDYGANLNGSNLNGWVNQGAINVKGLADERDIGAGFSFELNGESGEFKVFKTPEQSSSQDEQKQSEEQEEEKSEESDDEGDSSGASDEEQEKSDLTSSETSKDSSEADLAGGEESNTADDSLLVKSETHSTDTTSLPATDLTQDNNQADQKQVTLISPDPTGDGTAAEVGSVLAVAFVQNDSGDWKGNSGSMTVDDDSGITLVQYQQDQNTTYYNVVTGIKHVDTELVNGTASNPNNVDPCNPCVFTGPSQVIHGSTAPPSNLAFVQNATVDNTKVTWGRWVQDYELKENNVVIDITGGLHFIYAESETPAATVQAKQGEYIYHFDLNSGSGATRPSIEVENTHESILVTYDANAGAADRGTHFTVDFDNQNLTGVMIQANVTVNSGESSRFYNLSLSKDGQGNQEPVSLNTVIDHGEVQLVGTCTGGVCPSFSSGGVNMEGHMTIDFVGGDAEGAISSYGAQATTSVYDVGSASSTTPSISGTVLFKGEQQP